MTLTGAIVRPDARAWAAIPQRVSARRQTLLAWFTGLVTIGAAFIADRGWEEFDGPAWAGGYRATDMMGTASMVLLGLFAVFGWVLGRYAVTAAPLVLLFAAIPHTLDGYASATVWWLGAAVGAVLAAVAAGASVRQMRAVRALAQTSVTGRTAAVGPNAVQARKRMLRGGLLKTLFFLGAALAGWAAALALLPAELGRTYGELREDTPGSSMLTAAAAAASIMAVAEALKQAWRKLAMSRVGTHLVWEIPIGSGIVSLWPYMGNDSGLVPMEETKAAGCNCMPEFRRTCPGAEDELLQDEGIQPSDYCLLHGIDRINGLSAGEFAALAEEPWLWDERSGLPEPAYPGETRQLLYGFAGHAFTGVPVRKRAGYIDAAFPVIGPAQEIEPGTAIPGWDKAERPDSGVLDTLDLRPAGYNGYAFRYRHGRAWFESAQAAASTAGG